MKKGLIVFFVLLLVLLISVAAGKFFTDKEVALLQSHLETERGVNQPDVVSFADLKSLPPPVLRYFQHALTDGQPLIKESFFNHTGFIKTSPESQKWMSFSSKQVVSPLTPGFFWDAKVFFPNEFFHVRVIDSYAGGIGAGKVKILSAVTVAKDENKLELNSGALHRYLAEGAWTPTLLLPRSGLSWTAIDEKSALATLSDKKISVSLKFIFNEKNEIAGIYSPGRWGTFDGSYKQMAWEGHFSDYRKVQGMLIPFEGEVGWYNKEHLNIVWKGKINTALFKK
jgi:hypothetical protein